MVPRCPVCHGSVDATAVVISVAIAWMYPGVCCVWHVTKMEEGSPVRLMGQQVWPVLHPLSD